MSAPFTLLCLRGLYRHLPGERTDARLRASQIIRQVLYGQRAALLGAPALWYCARCARCSFQCPQDVRFLDIIQGLRNLALRDSFISPARVARLEQGERLIQELRRRLIGELLEGPEGLEVKDALARIADEVD